MKILKNLKGELIQTSLDIGKEKIIILRKYMREKRKENYDKMTEVRE